MEASLLAIRPSYLISAARKRAPAYGNTVWGQNTYKIPQTTHLGLSREF